VCLSPEAYVEARIYDRLVQRGVKPWRARGVARKVRGRYAEKRRAAASLRTR